MRKKLFIDALLIVLTATASGVQSAALYVGPDAIVRNKASTLFVKGNLIILPRGAIRNDGMIKITGNFTANGSYSSTGAEQFIGTGNQTVTEAVTGTNNFGYLDKVNTGDLITNGTIQCDSASIAGGVIDLTNGDTMLVRNGLPSALKGFNSSNTIRVGNSTGQGALARFSDRVATYAFPLSNTGTGYRRVDIQVDTIPTPGYMYGSLVNGPPSISSFYYNRTFASPSFTITLDCLTDNYYHFDIPITHTFRAKAYTSPCVTGNISLVVTQPVSSDTWNSEVENVTGDLALNLYNNADFTDIMTPKSSAMHRGESIDVVLASGINSVLPVELLSLIARPIDNTFIRVKWQTASEWNNSGFILERMTNASWTSIGWIDGNGTTSSTHSYSFDDHNVVTNTDYYYRLRQEDINGEIKISPIVSAHLNSNKTFVGNVYPSPGDRDQYLPVFMVEEQTITLQYINMIGQEVLQEKITLKGVQNIRLYNMLAAGTYSLKIDIGTESVIKRYVKK